MVVRVVCEHPFMMLKSIYLGEVEGATLFSGKHVSCADHTMLAD
jgi:hypothetical protein